MDRAWGYQKRIPCIGQKTEGKIQFSRSRYMWKGNSKTCKVH
jgi:hypothetical protein